MSVNVLTIIWCIVCQGPLKKFAQALGRMQQKFKDNLAIIKKSPIKIYVVTARSAASSGERAIKVKTGEIITQGCVNWFYDLVVDLLKAKIFRDWLLWKNIYDRESLFIKKTRIMFKGKYRPLQY